MLGLKLPTDPRWADIVASNIDDILTDHAWCEQKAATNAMTIVINNPELTDMVSDLISLAKEELEHFEQVHNLIKSRGKALGREQKDEYVIDLFKFMDRGSRESALVDRLLFSAMIEARSCERFKLLSEKLEDIELAEFYRNLMVSEAGHYTTFIGYARKYAEKIDVDKRWKEWLVYEKEVISNYGKRETIHG